MEIIAVDIGDDMKKIMICTFFLLIIILFNNMYANKSSLIAPTRTNDKLIVALDWFANPDHAPLIIANQQGFF